MCVVSSVELCAAVPCALGRTAKSTRLKFATLDCIREASELVVTCVPQELCVFEFVRISAVTREQGVQEQDGQIQFQIGSRSRPEVFTGDEMTTALSSLFISI